METVVKNQRARLEEVEIQALSEFCLANQTPRTLTIYIMLREHMLLDIINLTIDAKHYREKDLESFRVDYQATSMLAKSVNLSLEHVNRDAEALRKFYMAEEQCLITNQVLLNWGCNPNDTPWMIPIVARAQQIIHNILGPLDSKSLSFVEEHCRFGPGSTRTCKRHATNGRKFDNPRPGATPRCAEFLKPLLPALWADCITDISLIAASGITTVPKNAKTNRTIGIEPDLNIWLQLGTGALIRDKLRIFGVDLDKQADRNALLAQRALFHNNCTIDLSSASDCVSRSLVHLLLPEEWRHLLWLSRTDYYELNGVTHPFHKWSSMGNGYTFELESLIFLALARACGDSRAVAYGDDIICSKEIAPLLVRTLNFVGFNVNKEKTFLDGLFYESCGTDWFCGENVRPVFLKGNLNDEFTATDDTACLNTLAIIYQYANALSAVAHRAGHGFYRDRRYFSSWRSLLKAVPPAYRYRIPAGFNPRGGFEVDWDERGNTPGSASGFTYLGFTPRSVSTWGDRGPYLSSLHRLERVKHHGSQRRSLREESLLLAKQALSDRSYDRDGESVRYEGSLSTTIGSCFAWPCRGPWL